MSVIGVRDGTVCGELDRWLRVLMTTLSEIEHAADALPPEQKQQLVQFLLTRLGPHGGVTPSFTLSPRGHSIMDIQPVHLGEVLRPLTPDDDLLGEMLEGRT